jgi:UPF0716 protein FxsA
MRPSLLPLLVLILPLAEIAGFVVVGKAIGLLATLGLVILGTIVGAALLRVQGISILRRLSEVSREGGVPGREFVHRAMVVVAGLLLLIPGFVTDILGLALLIPGVRDLAWKYLSRRIVILGSSRAFSRSRGEPGRSADGAGPVVDLDADEFKRKSGGPSPWSPGKRLGE